MPVNLGFGGFEDPNAQPSIGRSISAAMSPNAQGFSGTLRAFLNPGPTLAAERQDQWKAVLQKTWADNQPLIQSGIQSLESGDPQGGLRAIQQASVEFQKAGLDPTPVQNYFNSYAASLDQSKLRGMNPQSPDYLKQVGSVLTKPEQAMALSGRGQSNLESGGRMEHNAALTSQVQQTTENQGLLAPLQRARVQRLTDLTGSQIGTQEAQQAELGQRGNLAAAQTERVNTGNQFDQAKAAFFDKNQMLPGTENKGGHAQNYLGTEGQHATRVAKAIADINQGAKGLGGMREPYPVEQATQIAASINAYADQVELQTGQPQAHIDVFQGPDTQDINSKTGEKMTIPGGAQARMRMGRQQQAPPMQDAPGQQGQAPPFTLPLTTQNLAQTPDEQIGQVKFDEQSLAPHQRAQIHAIRREWQAAARSTPADKQAALKTLYNKKMLSALAAGGSSRANH